MKLLAQVNLSEPLNAATNQIQGASMWVDQAKGWLTTNGLSFATNVIAAVIVYLIGKFIANFVRSMIVKVFKARGLDSTLGQYTGSIVYALVMIMVIITALGKLGVQTAQFAALIAAAGLAIGMALQGNLANFASGFLLVFFRPVKVGDYVAVGGAEGSVQEIGIFTTSLNTLDNKKVIVPNSAITSANITNFSANPTRAINIPISVSMSNSSDDVKQALIAAAQDDSRILADPAPAAMIMELAEGKMVMNLRAWCRPADYWAVFHQLNENVKKRTEAAEVLPFMAQRVLNIIKDDK